MSPMKKLLVIIILNLCFIIPSKADNIKDFEVEGISVGDSLLKYFPESEIKRFFNYDHLPSDMRYRIAEVDKNQTTKLKIYDGIQFIYKPNDKNYIIHSISAAVDCNSHKQCLNLKKKIIKGVTTIFKSAKPQNSTYKHIDDKSGKSTVEASKIVSLKKGEVWVNYYNWSENVTWRKNVRVSVNTNDVIKWIRNNYGAK